MQHPLPSSEKHIARAPKVRACAECRRLKLRCDKKFPCQACVRRGCSAICPDKCFTDEATPSSLKASNLRSREEIQSLKARIATLEKALAAAQPARNLLTPATSPSPLRSTGEETENAVEEIVDIFGTLSMAEDGSTTFHGATSMSEYFVQKSSDSHGLQTLEQTSLPSNLQLLGVLFPFPPHSVAAALDPNDFLPFLPSPDEVLEVTGRYWYHLSMGYSPICRSQFQKNVYDRFYPNNETKTSLERSDSHPLGVLFITLALGALTDINKPMLSTGAETYHQLARAALCLDPICDNTTISALQCMLSMNWYMRTAPNRVSTGYLWAFNGIILKLGTSIGIFRDSRKWIADIDEVEQREVVCWELMCMESWQAFITGRPCSLDLTLVDCQLPAESASGSAGLPGFFVGYHYWKYRFFSLMNGVLLVVLRPGPVKYSEILLQEQKLRDCTLPEGLARPLCGSLLDGLPENATTMHLQRFTALMIRETACCLLHRRFLVLAMQHKLDDPTKEDNPFRYSAFQAARGACYIVKSHMTMYRRHRELVSRAATFWSMSFSAAVILGAISARYWDRDFTHHTLVPFEQICSLFAEAAGTSVQPINALECLQRLQERVRAHFPHGSISDPATGAVYLPLLGVQPRKMVPNFNQDQDHLNVIPVPSEPPTLAGGDAPPTPSSSVSPENGDTEMSFPENIEAWPVPDPAILQDESLGDFPLLWEGEGQGLQATLYDGVSGSPLQSADGGPSRAEVGQWNQFLDYMGVWE